MKISRQPRFLPVHAQQPVGQAMKGTNPHAAHRQSHQLINSAAHFPRSLIGECHGEDGKRGHIFGLQQPGNAMYKHPGLSAARSSKNEQIRCRARHRISLLVVERVEYMRHIHGRILTSRGNCVPENGCKFAEKHWCGLVSLGASEP